MSSSGAAVGFPGAKADWTGVTRRGSLVGEGSRNGTGLDVGTASGAEVQAYKISKKDELKHKMKGDFFI